MTGPTRGQPAAQTVAARRPSVRPAGVRAPAAPTGAAVYDEASTARSHSTRLAVAAAAAAPVGTGPAVPVVR